MKKYEGLFILDTAGKEEGIKDVMDRISADTTDAGGRVENVQKMDKRNFTRVADRKHSSGFYVNFIFEIDPGAVNHLRQRFDLNDEVFRVLFTVAPPPKEATQPKYGIMASFNKVILMGHLTRVPELRYTPKRT